MAEYEKREREREREEGGESEEIHKKAK